MKNSIDISKEEYLLLHRYIGQGKLNASLVFFGIEPGTSGAGWEETLQFLKEEPHHTIGKGFLLKESYSNPTASDFVTFMMRLYLGLKNKDTRWFEDLPTLAKVEINKYGNIPVQEKDICLVNLRPLPRPSQDTWVYPDIDVKGYNRLWNFMLKRHYSDPNKEMRLEVLKKFFDERTGLVIGIGEKDNKRRFFETLYPDIIFYQADLDTHNIYFSIKHKIILSNYFNNRNGIKIIGLKDLYNFIVTRKLI
jgi:hypothetical protein